MSRKLKKLTFLHVLLIVLAIGLLIRVDDFRAKIGEAVAADKSEAVDPKVADKPKDEAKKDDAKDDGHADDKKTDKPHDDAADVKSAATEPPLDELSNADLGVLQQLSERRRQLDEREKQINQQDALVQAAQAELGRKFKELESLRTQIKQLLDQQSEAEEARLTSLVKVYEGMKPAEAANILNTLDTGVLMQVMGRMSERKMSPVLANMNPDRAREVTIRLAKQKQLPAAPADPSPAASLPGTGAPAAAAPAPATTAPANIDKTEPKTAPEPAPSNAPPKP